MAKDSPLVNSILQVFSDYEENWNAKLNECNERIARLQKEVARLEAELLKTTAIDDVVDEALKIRLSRLKSAPLDTVIREAGVLLEDRLRATGDESTKDLHGMDLVNAIFKPENGFVSFTNHPAEQSGVLLLYKGALQFVRNPPMHRLVEYPEGTAIALMRIIDSLLVLLTDATSPKTGDVALDDVRFMLKRHSVSTNQKRLFELLLEAGENGMNNVQLAEALDISRSSFAGLLGALGRRINMTRGLEGKGGILVIFDMTQADNDTWCYKIRPIFRQALEAEKFIK